MKVIATIRRTIVTDVPVTLSVADPAGAVAEAIKAARALQIGENGEVDLRAEAVVQRVEDAGTGKLIFENREEQPSIAPGFLEVVWRAQVRAEDHDHAASIARILQADPESPMSVFEVTDSAGARRVVNLQDMGTYVH